MSNQHVQPIFNGRALSKGMNTRKQGSWIISEASCRSCLQHINLYLSLSLVFFLRCMLLKGKEITVLSVEKGPECAFLYYLYSRVVGWWYGYKPEAFIILKGVMNGHARKYFIRKMNLKGESLFHSSLIMVLSGDANWKLIHLHFKSTVHEAVVRKGERIKKENGLQNTDQS